MIGDVSFYYPWFKPSLHYRVCDDMINPAGSLSRVGLLIVRIIPKRNIRNTKFWTLLFASKSSKLILNSPAKITSLREISRFERKRERERESFELRHINIRMLWNLLGGLFWIYISFLQKNTEPSSPVLFPG